MPINPRSGEEQKAVLDPITGAQHRPPRWHTRPGRIRTTRPGVEFRNVIKPVSTPFQIACEWIFPWSIFNYPGHGRGILAVLGRSITQRSVSYWKQKDNPPVWAAQAIRDHIARRCEVGLRLVSELDAYIARREAEVRHQPGALKRRPDE